MCVKNSRISTSLPPAENAPEKLVEAADLVTEMKEIKHPFHAGIFAQQGIEF